MLSRLRGAGICILCARTVEGVVVVGGSILLEGNFLRYRKFWIFNFVFYFKFVLMWQKLHLVQEIMF